MPGHETEVKKKLGKQIEEIEQIDKSGLEVVADLYNKYVGKLKELNKLTEEQFRKDRFGLDKELTPDNLERFKTLYRESGTFGEKLLKEMEDKQLPLNPEIIRNIQETLSQDMNVLKDVDEKTLEGGDVTLQRILSDARVRTVDITNKDLGTVGANLSSRIPFNYVEPDGNIISGVFTPRTDFDVDAFFDKFFDDLKESAPHFIPWMKDFKDGAEEYVNSLLEGMGWEEEDIKLFPKGRKIYHALRQLEDPNNAEISSVSVIKGMGQVLSARKYEFKSFMISQESRDEMDAFKEKLDKLTTQFSVNYDQTKVEEGSRIDSRNAAMSSVAELLGVSHLICKAYSMKIKKGEKETEGTFMAKAEGVDVAAPDVEYTDPKYASDGAAFKECSGFKDVADLQIVDFICGNTDRHAGNMFYKFENGKFTGVQGIDNDASFGTYVPENPGDSNAHFTALDNLKVISSSMFSKVMSLNKDMLKLTLREHGLAEEEIDAAGKRLEMLQQYLIKNQRSYNPVADKDLRYIEPGTICKVEDDDFNKLKLETLTNANGSNSFVMVSAFQASCMMNAGKKAPEMKTIEEEKLCTLGQDEADWASGLVERLSAVTAPNRTSKYFIDVQKAAELYKGFCETNKGSVLSEDLMSLKEKYLENIKKKAHAYGEYKKSVRHPSEYTRKRIETVSVIFAEADTKLNESVMARYADGKHLHEYFDRSIDDFNAKMRKMALEIEKNNKKSPVSAENSEELIGKKEKSPVLQSF